MAKSLQTVRTPRAVGTVECRTEVIIHTHKMTHFELGAGDVQFIFRMLVLIGRDVLYLATERRMTGSHGRVVMAAI